MKTTTLSPLVPGSTPDPALNKSRYNTIKTVIFLPLQRIITLPVRRIIHYYTVGEYVTMFLVAFVSVAILVLVGFLSAELFR